MLIAQNKKQELIFAEHSLDKKDNYYCPSCQTPVHLKKGSVMRPHFAHFQKQTCQVFTEGETLEHIEGKLQLAEWLESLQLQVEMEAYLPELSQRPDLLVTINNEKVALEFQCSPIAIAKIAQRTRGYLKAGYRVVWVLGQKFIYKKNLTAFQKACLANISQHFMLFHYHTIRQELVVWSHFHLDPNERWQTQKQEIKKGSKIKWTARPRKLPPLQKGDLKKQHRQLLRLRSDSMIQFQRLLYENQDNLITMPKELYTVLPNQWLIQDFPYLWKYQLILWLESFPRRTVLTPKALLNWLHLKNFTFYTVPQATTEQFLQPIYELLEVLQREKYIKEVGHKRWSIRQPIKRYTFLEEKLKSP